jgi:cell division protein FtsA
VGEYVNGYVDFIGVGTVPSYGLKKGIVVDIESTVSSIKQAVKEAEAMANVVIGAVHVGIAGAHISSIQSHGVIPIKDNEISQKDIDKVIDAAQAVAIPMDREILHIVPIEYIVDGQDGIRDPRGMSGVRLEANVHIITGAVAAAQNLIKCCQKSGLDVLEIVLQPIASAEAVLTEDEKELGVGLIDIGGGTTDVALVKGGSVIHSAILGIGGNNFTHDISVGLRTPANEAERIKKEHGCVMVNLVDREKEVQVVYAGGRPPKSIPAYYLSEILQPRAEEIFEIIKMGLKRNNFHELIASGLVLTGGSAVMPGMIPLAESLLELPVRLGRPNVGGPIKSAINNPEFATSVGMVLHGAKQVSNVDKFKKGNVFKTIYKKMKSWFKGIF